MAKIEFDEKESSKKYLTLKDCKVGDIVLLGEKVYIITHLRLEYSEVSVLDLQNAEEYEDYSPNMCCAVYTKPLRFEKNAFQEYL